MQFADVACALKTQTAIIIAYSSLPFLKKAQRRPSAPMQTAAFRFILYSIFSISENLIQFPFHGACLGKFQRKITLLHGR